MYFISAAARRKTHIYFFVFPLSADFETTVGKLKSFNRYGLNKTSELKKMIECIKILGI